MEFINIIVVIELVCVQVIGAINRYVPYRRYLTAKQKKYIYRTYAVIMILSAIFYFALLSPGENIILSVKKIAFVGFLPYFIANLILIPNNFFKHLFLMGMHGMYYAVFQTLSLLVVLFLDFDLTKPYLMALQLGIYIIQYIITYKYVIRIFEALMPENTIFEKTAGYKKYFAVIPIIFVSAHIPNSMQDRFLNVEELIPRIFILGGFFLFYKFVITNADDNFNALKSANDNKFMRRQLAELHNHIIMQNYSQEKTVVMRHDFRHNLRMIYTLLESRQIDKAMEFIKMLEGKIEQAAYRPYCQHPIINAALSVYINKAERKGIEVEYKINIPTNVCNIIEDYAVVLSNILENAIIATAKEPEGKRGMKIVIQTRGRQMITSIKNTCSEEIPLKDGFPYTSRDGHGIGMVSLRNFAKENNAIIDFTQQNGWIHFMMYWIIKK